MWYRDKKKIGNRKDKFYEYEELAHCKSPKIGD